VVDVSRVAPAVVAAAARLLPPRIKFDVDEAELASDTWKFNCGPAAVCGLFGLTPSEVRPHMGDFWRKGYTNPTLMYGALRSLGKSFTHVAPAWPDRGLVRIQWHGRWMNEGVPIAARYRKTHWVASWNVGPARLIFDINNTAAGGWMSFFEWDEQLVPWLIKECVPGGDGKYSIAHSLEVACG
jgi:hypothetical protein